MKHIELENEFKTKKQQEIQQNEVEKPLKSEITQIEIKDQNQQSVQHSQIFEIIEIKEEATISKFFKKKLENISNEKINQFINEYKILQHPNILEFQCIFYGNKQFPASILFEFCPNNLEQAIAKKLLSKVQTVYSIYQISEIMNYLHSRKIIHGNLNPSNIYISDDFTIKIFDFGIARTITNQNKSNQNKSQEFIAPEILKGEQFDESADIYSFGVISYFILSGGNLPSFGNSTDFELLAQQLFEACIETESENRPSFSMICNILEENEFKLISMTQQENEELIKMIHNYKSLIPTYSEQT